MKTITNDVPALVDLLQESIIGFELENNEVTIDDDTTIYALKDAIDILKDHQVKLDTETFTLTVTFN